MNAGSGWSEKGFLEAANTRVKPLKVLLSHNSAVVLIWTGKFIFLIDWQAETQIGVMWENENEDQRRRNVAAALRIQWQCFCCAHSLIRHIASFLLFW